MSKSSYRRTNTRDYLFITLTLLAAFLVGCNDDSPPPPGAAGNDDRAWALSESDFIGAPALFAQPDKGVVVSILEPITAPAAQNQTGVLGEDILPYRYTQDANHTFCWEDPDPNAGHLMVLKDALGNERLRVVANQGCETAFLEAGLYRLHLFHDNKTPDSYPVFLQPQGNGRKMAQHQGIYDRLLALLGSLVPVETAMAADAADLETFMSTAYCIDCDLEGANLSGIQQCGDNLDDEWSLAGSDLDYATVWIAFCHASMAEISARYADLSGGIFFETIFSDSDLTGANMANGYFEAAWFINTDMLDADLTSADLVYTLLTNARFTDATLDNADLSSSFDTKTADFSGASLKGTNLSGLDLSTAGLFDGLDATGANFSGATISGVTMLFVNFTDADLSGADLSDFICIDCTLTGADLTGADLTGAGMDYTGATWTDGSCVCTDEGCTNC